MYFFFLCYNTYKESLYIISSRRKIIKYIYIYQLIIVILTFNTIKAETILKTNMMKIKFSLF